VQTLFRGPVGERIAVVVATDADDGDFHPGRVDADDLRRRQLRVTSDRWTMVDEVHGIAVHSADADTVRPSAWPLAGAGDVIVTSRLGSPIAIWAADCAPVALFGHRGTTIVIHAGWRGLAAGILDVGLATLADRGDAAQLAVLGPVIHPCCYEFGLDDLRSVARSLGVEPDEIAGRARSGARALDVPAAVAVGLRGGGVELAVTGPCTGCGGRWFSHRCRGDLGRHALVAWSETAPAADHRVDAHRRTDRGDQRVE
jgi:purine-nucleoside/S-methyl-5'-thioadenosine phosphorylase / adenosine deaminase